MKTIYAQLLLIAQANPTLLVAYKTDLTNHDLTDLRRSVAGEEYLWILRDHGTELYIMPHAFNNPELNFANKFKHINTKYACASYWIHEEYPHREHPYKFFHIKVEKPMYGTVEEISHVDAIALMNPMPTIIRDLQEVAKKDAEKGVFWIPEGIDDSLGDYYRDAYRLHQLDCIRRVSKY